MPLLTGKKDAGHNIEIVSGEGERGSSDTYAGPLTTQAVKSRLTHESRGGRWAYLRIDGRRIPPSEIDSAVRWAASAKDALPAPIPMSKVRGRDDVHYTKADLEFALREAEKSFREHKAKFKNFEGTARWRAMYDRIQSLKKELAQAKDSLPAPIPMNCKDEHEGFAKLEHSLAHKKGVSDPDALAAAIGRKKYGTAGMAARSAAARDDTAGNLRAAAAVKALEDLERAERQAAKMASTVNADHFVRPFKDRYEKARQAWKAGMARAKDAKDPWYDERIKELEQEVARCKREGEPYADELRDIAEYKKERDDRARAVARSMSRDALPEPV